MIFTKKHPRIPTTIKKIGVNITTIAYLRFLSIEIGSTIILMVMEAHGTHYFLRPAISSFKAGEDFSHERSSSSFFNTAEDGAPT